MGHDMPMVPTEIIDHFRDRLDYITNELQCQNKYVTGQITQLRSEMRGIKDYADEQIRHAEQRVTARQDVSDRRWEEKEKHFAAEMSALRADLLTSIKGEGAQLRELISVDQASRLREQNLISDFLRQRFTDEVPLKGRFMDVLGVQGELKGKLAYVVIIVSLVISALVSFVLRK